jgi:hypothetical protein
MSDVPSPAADPSPLPKRRRWLVYALATALIVGHAFDVVTKGEHWPISSYPMYADLNPSDFRMIRLVGVKDETPQREIPMDGAWIRNSLLRLARRPDADARLREAVSAYAHSAGWERPHDGGPFIAYRVYEQRWQLRADADPDRKPDEAKLLVELWRPPEETSRDAAR